MRLYIKNMVCERCVSAVRRELARLGVVPRSIQLGETELTEELTNEQLNRLGEWLKATGFELVADAKSRIVEKVKNIIVSYVHYNHDFSLKLSAILEEKIGFDYHYLTTLFTAIEGVTIEKYTIAQRIERAKELLMYNELNINEVALQLGYSSVQHLSQQFKKITGLTPSAFKNLKQNNRKPLDKMFR
ncbi:MAG TPA: AraC family transcriptional regulator [Chitinophagaceae bacterium]|jgi:AraC-like DNA-binding protein|nr:AraC family transcriptional regulator [Chitinophagaceae bacterium]